MHMGLWHALLDALLPHHCAHCRKLGTPLCDTCMASIHFKVLTAKSDLVPHYTSTAHLHGSPALRSAIHALKYSGVRALAPILATSMRDALVAHPVLSENPILMPVPMWPSRQQERGYNQAHELAHHLGLLCALEVRADLVARTRNTQSQVSSATRDQRIAHMNGAFSCPVAPSSRPIVIIDDVITTGATVSACRQALLDAGARDVRILGLAHG
jgi:ComF family protein